MKLSEIVDGYDCEILGDKDTEISGVTDKTENVTIGGMFVAIRGMRYDGNSFVPDAIKLGASVVVVEKPLPLANCVQVVVPNARKAVAQFSAAFYGNPARDMKMIGVTGTNGKTTTTHIIRHILNESGIKCGLIGTSGCFWDDKRIDYGLTTPDPIDLQKTLYIMRQDGVRAVAMEVSAHALDLFKTEPIKFDVGIFTNITRDHFDYFKTMENYKKAKQKLFCPNKCKSAIVCTDDEFGKELLSTIKTEAQGYGTTKTDNTIIRNRLTSSGQEFLVQSASSMNQFFVPLFGEYNAKNALAAVLACKELGVSVDRIKESLATLPHVAGRFETYFSKNGAMIIVDYAHSPDGLQNLLTAARKIANERGGRLISLFGCGGNRDKGKRPQMGKISEDLADFTILTSDNPRYEKPKEIIDQISGGMSDFSHIAIEDRTTAIALGVKLLGQNDVLVVAGKGNENYLDVGGVKVPYSDDNAVNEAILKKE